MLQYNNMYKVDQQFLIDLVSKYSFFILQRDLWNNLFSTFLSDVHEHINVNHLKILKPLTPRQVIHIA